MTYERPKESPEPLPIYDSVVAWLEAKDPTSAPQRRQSRQARRTAGEQRPSKAAPAE